MGRSSSQCGLTGGSGSVGLEQTVGATTVGLFFGGGSLLLLVIPPLLFSYIEGWTVGEGFYFAFITLSTIGFGDYVVGE